MKRFKVDLQSANKS